MNGGEWSIIEVDITKTYIIKVPQNTFKDNEQGNTRHLRLELKDIFGNKIEKNFWVQFDAGGQTLTIVATKDNALTLQPTSIQRLQLFAFDVQNQQAVMEIQIKILYPTVQASHYVSMQLTVISKPLQYSTFTTIYNRQRNLKFFVPQLCI